MKDPKNDVDELLLRDSLRLALEQAKLVAPLIVPRGEAVDESREARYTG